MPEKRLSIIPPEVTAEDLEDFLATDDLFIDYFNSFLQLPTFPEPLTFNKESGGFEVVSDAKLDLKFRLRSMVLSKQKRKPIYNASYKVINAKKPPKMPWHYDESEDQEELQTSYKVQCLNKDQGIHWVKEERLPAFLQSDVYLEYRLAKLISQTEIAAKEADCPLNLLIDPSYAPFAIEKPPVEEEEVIDEQELAVRNMFVCMGNAPTTQTDEWFSQVKMESDMRLTTASSSRPSSAVAGLSASRPTSARPLSEMSSRYTRVDSGFVTPRRADAFSSPGSPYPDSTTVTFEDQLPNRDHLFTSPLRPRSPPVWRPPIGDDVCVIADGTASAKSYGGPVYMQTGPQAASLVEPDADNSDKVSDESGFDVESQQLADEEEEELDVPIPEDVTQVDPAIKVDSLDNLATLIITHAFRSALREVSDKTLDEIEAYLDETVLSSSPIKCKSLVSNWMDLVEVGSNFGDSDSDGGQGDVSQQLDRSVSKISRTISSLGGRDAADTESLFDSDEEKEVNVDPFFSKPKPTYDFTTKGGMDAFKKFLLGSVGEKYWNLWLDIDKGRQIADSEIELIYMTQLREKYAKSGSICEISEELRNRLGLGEPSQWTSLDRLLAVQPKIAETLLLYWAPSFLMREAYQCNLGNNQIYQSQKLIMKPKPVSYHEPRAITLLPLRPKTCKPRLKGNQISTKKLSTKKVTSVKQPLTQPATHKEDSDTSPRLPKKLPLIPASAALTSIVPKKPAPPKSQISKKIIKQQTLAKENASVPPVTTKTRFDTVDMELSRENEGVSISEKGDNVSMDKMPPDERSGKARPSSSPSSIASEESEFLGSLRMESLLYGLYHEKKAGGFFMKYLEKTENELAMNCLCCWHELQEYHTLFYAEVFSPYELARKAQSIHAKFIVDGCFYDIECSSEIREQVYHQVLPPFEDLFDFAEEYIFQVLVDPWSEMKGTDKRLYDKIQLTEEDRQLQGLKSKHLQRLQRKLNREKMVMPDFGFECEDEEARRESQYAALAEKVPLEYKDFDFNKLIHNRVEMEHFRQFLDSNYAIMDLLCWMDIESFRRTPHHDSAKRDQKAKDVKTKYLNKKYFFGSNSPASRKQQNEMMINGGGWGKLLLDRTPTPILLEAQKFVRERLERKWLPLFICTEEFQERQRPNVKLGDLVDDMLFNKKKRSQAIYKILESRWVTSSRDIIAFRQALINPVSCQKFRKFVSVKGEMLENDVIFWLEVQKFKDMFHNHTEESLIVQKVNAIVRCFVNSEIPPALQIDITPEQAEKIIDKRPKEMGPYMFRDAQLTVFRVLFSHWSDFQKYRNTINEDKMLEDLEKKRKKQRKKELEQMRIEEEKERKQSASYKEEFLFRRASKGSNFFADFFDDEEEDEKVQWKYSDYINEIEREQRLLNGDDRASSLLSSINSLAEAQNQKPYKDGGAERILKNSDEGGQKLKTSMKAESSIRANQPECPTITRKKRVSIVEPMVANPKIGPVEQGKKTEVAGDKTSKGRIGSGKRAAVKPGGRPTSSKRKEKTLVAL